MEPTLYTQVIPGLIGIVVHTNTTPTDEEWDASTADLVAAAGSIKGVLVYSATVGPTTAQRARAGALFKERGHDDVMIVIMSGSRIVRGIVTAFSWTMSGSLKVFSTHDLEGAIASFKMSSEEEIKTRVILKQLAHSGGVKIDAFADESGHFRRKYTSK